MRTLHYVKSAAEGDGLVLETADGGERFVLGVDTALRDAVRTDRPRMTQSASTGAAGSAPRSGPQIGPREIQMRVRAGESPQQLAESFQTSLESIMRFAFPVLAERTRIADEARRGRARRSTTEGQSVVFGEAVDERFAAHGLDASTVRWDSHRRDDGQWIVTANWAGGTSEHTAEWAFQLGPRTVAPLDDAAADLLSDRPIRPVAPPAAAPSRLSLTDAPPLARGVVAFPSLGEVPPTPDEVFDQAVFEQQPGGAYDFDAPPLPLRLADEIPSAASASVKADSMSKAEQTGRLPRLTNLGVAARDDEPVPTRSGRPQVPSWDDILLGVRRKQD